MRTSNPDKQPPILMAEACSGSVPSAPKSHVSSSHLPRKSLPSRVTASVDPSLQMSEPSYPSLHDIKSAYQEGIAPSPLLPPTSSTGGLHSRSISADYGSRPGTSHSIIHSRPPTPSLAGSASRPTTPMPLTTGGKQKLKKGNAWFGGKRKDKNSPQGPVAWVAGHPQKLPYELEGLLLARPEIDLCNEVDGDCFVHLWPKSLRRGASFKVNSSIFAASPALTRLASGDMRDEHNVTGPTRTEISFDNRTQRLSLDDTSAHTTTLHHHEKNTSSISSGESRSRMSNSSGNSRGVSLYLPLGINLDVPTVDVTVLTEDMQKLIDVRNFFAFLCGQSLIATERKQSFFDIFMTVARQLRTYGFSNLDGSTFGKVANDSFEMYVDELQLADVRQSREKTIEGIVLGEHMKSTLLYNEAFTHGVGKYHDLVALKAPKFELITRVTQNRLVSAARDLDKRTAAIREVLTDFNFPSLFSGIMNSKMSEERKEGVRFEAWKEAFLGTRKYFTNLLQQRYGHWPPKVRSKKNDLETSGLSRVVLVDLYKDLASLYDLLVDRGNLVNGTLDGIGSNGAREEPTIRALRTILREYDRSSPPVKPPVPFDVPHIPTLKATRPDFGTGDKKLEAKAVTKKLKDDEILKILRHTWHGDSLVTPFIDAFREMEKRAAHSCNISEIQDLRMGQWIFIYAVLQALPMLAMDAPGVTHNQGVEYFLCEPPRSGVPWVHLATSGATEISGDGSAAVSLPADLVEHGVEGIYRRSHCWQAAEKWTVTNPILNEALREQRPMSYSPFTGINNVHRHQDSVFLTAQETTFLDANSASGHHLHSAHMRNSSVSRGAQTLPLPPGATSSRSLSRPTSPAQPTSLRPHTPAHEVDATKTFDAILANVGGPSPGKGKGGKKGGNKS
nr:hypothetical protein CFP56_46652 [Quercus suber]